MAKTVEMAKVSMRGGFHVFWGLAVSTIISAVGVVFLARLLTPAELGLVTVAWVAPNLLQNFRNWGINSAMIKYTAQYRAEGNIGNLKNIILAGWFFELLMGVLLSLILYLLSGYLATSVFNRPELEPLLQVISFTVFTGALLITAQSVFTGFERMEFYSFTLIARALFKAVLAPLMVIFGFGVLGVIVGSTAGLLIAGVLSVGIMYFAIRKRFQKPSDEKPSFTADLKSMLKYGLPLSITTILLGVRTQFFNFLLAIYVSDALIGNYQVALNFSVLISFFSMPILTVLFPAFSKLNAEKETETVKRIFQFSVKLSAFLVVPAAALIIALSVPAISTLFGVQYEFAPLYLALNAVSYLFSAFGNLSVGNLINSQGRTRVSLMFSLVASAIGFPLSLLLIPQFGVVGLIATTTITMIPVPLLGLWWIRKHYHVTVNWVASGKILLVAGVAAAVTYLTISLMALPSWVELVIGTGAFLVIYLTIAPLIRAVNETDLQSLKEMARALGPIFHVIDPLLAVMERLTPKT